MRLRNEENITKQRSIINNLRKKKVFTTFSLATDTRKKPERKNIEQREHRRKNVSCFKALDGRK